MNNRTIANAAVLCAALLLPVVGLASDAKHCYLRDATSPASSSAYLLCEQGLIYGTADGGVTWKANDTGATVTLHGLAFSDAQHGFVVGEAGTLLATEDGGKTWQPRVSGTKQNLLDICTFGNHVWASGFDGALIHSADGGRTWARQDPGTSMALESIYFLDADHGWAVGWSGTILRTTDGGKSWHAIKTDAAQWSLATVTFFDANNGWAGGFSGQLLQSTDGGTTWKAVQCPSRSRITSVAADKANRLWVAADDSLLVSEDNGKTWKAIPVPSSFFVSRVFRVGDSLWGLAELGLLKQSGNSLQWKHDETFVPVGALIGSSVDETLGATKAK